MSRKIPDSSGSNDLPPASLNIHASNEHIIAMNTNVQITDPVDILWHSCIDEEHMKDTVLESLKSQLMEWVKNGCFSSLWHIYAIANVLLKPVATLYPHVFSVGLPRSLYHAILKPWLLHEEVPPLLIMWTHTQNTSLWHWQPNHFVPCLQPATFPEAKPAEKDHGQMQDDDCKGSSEGVAESCADHGEIAESNSIKRKWVEIFNVSKVEKNVKHDTESISQETNKWDFANFVGKRWSREEIFEVLVNMYVPPEDHSFPATVTN